MNIFVLDLDPVRAAKMACDKHVLSGVREMTIMLSYVGRPPKKGYYHHKCSKWIRASQANFDWAISHARALCNEYTYRYGKTHANQAIIEEIKSNNLLFEQQDQTPFSCAVTSDCLCAYRQGPVGIYRYYYLNHKQHLLTYTRREIPEWVKAAGLGTWKEAKF